MAIEINGGAKTSTPTPIQAPSKVGVDVAASTVVQTATPEKNDSVALTATTQEIKKPVGSSSASPVNSDRVNAVKKALANGSYSVDPQKIANKLLQFEQLMPQENSSSS